MNKTDFNILIAKWTIEYDVPGTIEVYYEDLGRKLEGITYYSKDLAKIYINNRFAEHEIAVTGVLWHEYCHAEKWLKDKTTDGHSSAWYKRLMRKPIYALYSFYATLLFTFVR